MKTEVKKTDSLCPYCQEQLWPEIEWTGDFIPEHIESGRDVKVHVFICSSCDIQFVDPEELKEMEKIG